MRSTDQNIGSAHLFREPDATLYRNALPKRQATEGVGANMQAVDPIVRSLEPLVRRRNDTHEARKRMGQKRTRPEQKTDRFRTLQIRNLSLSANRISEKQPCPRRKKRAHHYIDKISRMHVHFAKIDYAAADPSTADKQDAGC